MCAETEFVIFCDLAVFFRRTVRQARYGGIRHTESQGKARCVGGSVYGNVFLSDGTAQQPHYPCPLSRPAFICSFSFFLGGFLSSALRMLSQSMATRTLQETGVAVVTVLYRLCDVGGLMPLCYETYLSQKNVTDRLWYSFIALYHAPLLLVRIRLYLALP